MEPPPVSKIGTASLYQDVARLNRALFLAPKETGSFGGVLWKCIRGEPLPLSLIQEIADQFNPYLNFRSPLTYETVPLCSTSSILYKDVLELTDRVESIYDPSLLKSELLAKLRRIAKSLFAPEEFSPAEVLLNEIEPFIPLDLTAFPRCKAGRIVKPDQTLLDLIGVMGCVLKQPNGIDSHVYEQCEKIFKAEFVQAVKIAPEKYLLAAKLAADCAFDALFKRTLNERLQPYTTEKGRRALQDDPSSVHSTDIPRNFACRGIVPPELACCNVEQITLNVQCKIRHFPSTLTKLQHLQVFKLLGENCFPVFPDFLTKISTLQRFEIESDANLSSVGKLTQIKTLVIGQHTLGEFFPGHPPVMPKEILELTQLTALYIKTSNLEELTDFALFQNLQRLDLILCGLTELPKGIGQLIHLRQLSCVDNRLKTLPEEIGNLIHLTQLSFRTNSLLETLPYTLGSLFELEYLECDFLALSLLPFSMVSCKNLKKIQGDHIGVFPVRLNVIFWSDKKPLNEFLKKPPFLKL